MKTSCNIIEDLLPLYVDDCVSGESRLLIEEHVKECENCQKLLEEMRKENLLVSEGKLPENKKAQSASGSKEEYGALKKIRSRIRRKNILAVIITAVLILAAVGEFHYYYYRPIYFSWEGSGLEIQGDKLISAERNSEGRIWSVISPDQKTEFMIMSETMEIRSRYPEDQNLGAVVTDLEEYEKASKKSSDEYTGETGVIPGIQKLYYVEPEYVDIAKNLWNYDEKDHALAEQKLKELEEHSVLIWSAEK